MNNYQLNYQSVFKSLGFPTVEDVYAGLSNRTKGLAGRNYKYPTRPAQGAKEKARRLRQRERGIIK